MGHHIKSRQSRNTKRGITEKMKHKTGHWTPEIRSVCKIMFKYLIQNVGKPSEPIFKKIETKLNSPEHFRYFKNCIMRSDVDYFRWGEDVYFSTISILDGFIVINNPVLCPNDLQHKFRHYYHYTRISFNGKCSNAVFSNHGLYERNRKQYKIERKYSTEKAVEQMIAHKHRQNLERKKICFPVKFVLLEDVVIIQNPYLY